MVGMRARVGIIMCKMVIRDVYGGGEWADMR